MYSSDLSPLSNLTMSFESPLTHNPRAAYDPTTPHLHLLSRPIDELIFSTFDICVYVSILLGCILLATISTAISLLQDCIDDWNYLRAAWVKYVLATMESLDVDDYDLDQLNSLLFSSFTGGNQSIFLSLLADMLPTVGELDGMEDVDALQIHYCGKNDSVILEREPERVLWTEGELEGTEQFPPLHFSDFPKGDSGMLTRIPDGFLPTDGELREMEEEDEKEEKEKRKMEKEREQLNRRKLTYSAASLCVRNSRNGNVGTAVGGGTAMLGQRTSFMSARGFWHDRERTVTENSRK